jgi:hypothetical protein
MSRGILQLLGNLKSETLRGAYRNGIERQTLHEYMGETKHKDGEEAGNEGRQTKDKKKTNKNKWKRVT